MKRTRTETFGSGSTTSSVVSTVYSEGEQMEPKRQRQETALVISNEQVQIEEKLHMIHWKTGIPMAQLRYLLEAIEKFSDVSQYYTSFYQFKNIFHCILHILLEHYSKISEFWKQEEDLKIVGHQIFGVVFNFLEQQLQQPTMEPLIQQSIIWSIQILSKMGALVFSSHDSSSSISYDSLLSLLTKYFHSPFESQEFQEQIQISLYSLLQHFILHLHSNTLRMEPIFKIVTSFPVTTLCKVKIEWIQTVHDLLQQHYLLEQSQWHLFVLKMMEYSQDGDARVRAVAIRVLSLCVSSPFLTMNNNNSIASKMYELTIASLEDDAVQVQLEAMDLLFLLAQQFYQFTISVDKAFDDSFCIVVNHAFCKFCKMLRRFDISIRCKALEYIGKLDHVHSVFLFKTFVNMELHFSKTHTKGRLFHFEMLSEEEIQSIIRLKFMQEKSAITNDSSQVNVWSVLEMQHKALLDLLQSSPLIENNSNRSQMQKLEVRDESLMKEDVVFSGPTGTFILGLEDETMQVRLATIEAISTIAIKNKEFAKRAISYLLIMFGDEMEQVRIRAIECVSQLSQQCKEQVTVQLSEEQLSIILSILEDANRQVRLAIHQLLQAVQLPNATCLYACVSALINLNLSKYMSEDRDSVYFLLKQLGMKHPAMVNLLVDNFLNSTDHWSLLTVERNIEDVQYACVLIVIYNAWLTLPQIESSLPRHVLKDHFPYFRSKFPLYFPSQGNTQLQVATQSNQTIFHLFDTIKEWKTMFENQSTITVWKMMLQQIQGLQMEMKQTASNNNSQQGVILFFSKLVSVLELYLNSLMTTTANEHKKKSCILKCFNMTYEIQLKFAMSNSYLQSMLKKIRLCCIINLWLHYKPSSPSDHRCSLTQFVNRELKKRIEHILAETKDDDVLQELSNQLDSISEKELHQFLEHYFPFSWKGKSEELFGSIQSVTCKIELPISNVNTPKPLVFLNNIPFEIQIKALLRNYEVISTEKDLFVILHLPNGKMMSFPLSVTKDLITIAKNKHMIEYVLEMELKEVWSESALIQIDIARRYKYDEEDSKSDFVLANFHSVKNYFSLTGNHGTTLNLQIS